MGPLWPGGLCRLRACEAIAARCFMRKGFEAHWQNISSSRWKSIASSLATGHHPVDWVHWSSHWSTAMAQMPNPVDTWRWGPLMGSTFCAQRGTRVQRSGGQTRRRPADGSHVVCADSPGRAGLTDFWASRRHWGVVLRRNSWSRAALAELARYAAWFVAPIAILNRMYPTGRASCSPQNQSHHRKRCLRDCSLLALGVWSGKFGGLVVAGTATSGLSGPRPLAVVAGAGSGSVEF